MAKFREIPQFVHDGHYEVNYGVVEFVKYMEENIVELGLNIDPDFQRGHVWTEQQQIDWLEFFLQGGRTGRTFYLNHPEWMKSWKGEFVLVDGKQRYNAIRRFVNNEIKVFGYYFREYEDHPDMVNHSVRVNVNTLKTRAEVLQWYLGFNSGGTPHSKEEIARVKELLAIEQNGKPKTVEKVTRRTNCKGA